MSKRQRSTQSVQQQRQQQGQVTQQPRQTSPNPRTVSPSTRRPSGEQKDRFGTNPAPGESHVSLPPELRHPNGGDGGYLDGFEDTMLA